MPNPDQPGRAQRLDVTARNIEQRLEDIGGYRAWLNDEAWTEMIQAAAKAAATVYEPIIDHYDTALVERALIDAQGDAIAGAALPAEHTGTGWAEWDLTAEQEIRARALDAAARTMATAMHPDPDRALGIAGRFEAYIRDGATPDPTNSTEPS